MFTVEIQSGLCNVLKSFITALSIDESTNILPRLDTHFDADYREILDDKHICHNPDEFYHSFVSARLLILKSEEEDQIDLINDAKVLGNSPDIQNPLLEHLFSKKTIDWFQERNLICEKVFNRIQKGIKQICWRPEVLSEVERIASQFIHPVLTVQIRTWTHKFDPKNILTIQDGVKRQQDFETQKNAIEIFAPSCKTIFLTSDNDSVLPQYLDAFKDYHIVTQQQPSDKTQMQYSAATMLLGAKSDYLVCSRLSTFSECMWWFGKCNAKVIPVF